MLTKKLKFSDEVLAVIAGMEWSDDGLTGKLTEQLDRKLYADTNKALEKMGGKWDRKAGAHVFQLDPRGLVDGLLDSGVLVVDRDGFFETPRPIVLQMMSSIGQYGKILEPSAGLGAIADAYPREFVPDIVCVELNVRRCRILLSKGYTVICKDFLEFRDGVFDTIIMNPPFENGQDMQHVQHAYSMLAPGGVLVSVMSSGSGWRGDKLAQQFRAWAERVGGTTEMLPPNSFRSSGTSVNTVLFRVGR